MRDLQEELVDSGAMASEDDPRILDNVRRVAKLDEVPQAMNARANAGSAKERVAGEGGGDIMFFLFVHARARAPPPLYIIHVRRHTCVCAHARVHVCIHLSLFTCVHVHTQTCLSRARVHVHVHTCVHARARVHDPPHTHARACTRARAQVSWFKD